MAMSFYAFLISRAAVGGITEGLTPAFRLLLFLYGNIEQLLAGWVSRAREHRTQNLWR